jgi:hypothetical protein
MPAKSNTEKFIKRAVNKHGNRYDYSKVNYKNISEKVIIICPIHGAFKQSPISHLLHKGCPFCSGKRNNTGFFIKRAIKRHGVTYDYSRVLYVNVKTPVLIVCKKHGSFKQLPANHLKGHGCPRCRAERLANKFKMSNDEIIAKARKVHGNFYVYDFLDQPKNNREKIKIICPVHGGFLQKINSHLMGSGCPKCKMSKGEIKVSEYLKTRNIKYVFQKRFNSCKKTHMLPFDFFLPDYNACIEFDGDQHRKEVHRFKGGGNFKKIQEHDRIKNIWARDNNISLIRIADIRDICLVLNELIKNKTTGNILIKEEREVLELYKQGYSLVEISKKFCTTPAWIRKNLVEKGVIIRSIKEQKNLDSKIRHPKSVFTSCLAKAVSKCGGIRDGRFCRTHWSAFYNGLIDKEGNKLREKYERTFSSCIAKNAGTGLCTVYKYGRFCSRHQNQFQSGIIDKNGNKLRDLFHGREYCAAKDAGTGPCHKIRHGRFCRFHYNQYVLGIIDKEGNKIRDLFKLGKRNIQTIKDYNE